MKIYLSIYLSIYIFASSSSASFPSWVPAPLTRAPSQLLSWMQSNADGIFPEISPEDAKVQHCSKSKLPCIGFFCSCDIKISRGIFGGTLFRTGIRNIPRTGVQNRGCQYHLSSPTCPWLDPNCSCGVRRLERPSSLKIPISVSFLERYTKLC